MYKKEEFYRSRNRVLGGVCSGLAEYFHVDVLMVRILVLLLGAATFGALYLVYGVAWLVFDFPPETNEACTLEVHHIDDEQRAHSVVSDAPKKRSDEDPSTAAHDLISLAYMPPAPPPAYCKEHPDAIKDYCTKVSQAPRLTSLSIDYDKKQVSESNRKFALIASLMAALGFSFTLVCFLIISLSEHLFLINIWPVLLSMVGIVFVMVPHPRRAVSLKYPFGMTLISAGLVGSLISLGFTSPESVGICLSYMWPLLVVCLLVCVIGLYYQSNLTLMFAGLSLGLIFFISFLFLADPGSLYSLDIVLFGKCFIIYNPWL